MKKTTFFIAFLLCFAGTADAQFLKKLGKTAEKTVERKTEQKTKKETEEVFDDAFNKEKNPAEQETHKSKGRGLPGLAKVAPADNYAFQHKVEMEIKAGKQVNLVNYYLTDNDNFFGTELKDEQLKDDFITVFDIDRETIYTYMENDGQKMQMGINLKIEEPVDEDVNEPDFVIVATGKTKSILGYQCQEFNMTGKDVKATLWVTKEVDIRFPSDFYSVQQNKRKKKNKTYNQEWMKQVDGWAMEMVMIDSSKRKPQTIIMNCLSITASDYKINSSEYKNLGQ